MRADAFNGLEVYPHHPVVHTDPLDQVWVEVNGRRLSQSGWIRIGGQATETLQANIKL